MNKELASRALDSAFVNNVNDLFKEFAGTYKADDKGNVKASDGARDVFLAKFHAAKQAHEDASSGLELVQSNTAFAPLQPRDPLADPSVAQREHLGPEDDAAYRVRLANTRSNRSSMGAAALRGLSGVDLDSYGVQVGVPRGEAKWSPPPPKPVDDAKKADEEKKPEPAKGAAK